MSWQSCSDALEFHFELSSEDAQQRQFLPIKGRPHPVVLLDLFTSSPCPQPRRPEDMVSPKAGVSHRSLPAGLYGRRCIFSYRMDLSLPHAPHNARWSSEPQDISQRCEAEQCAWGTDERGRILTGQFDLDPIFELGSSKSRPL